MAGNTVISKFAGLLLTSAEPISTTWDAWLDRLAAEPTALYSTTTGGWSAAEFDPPERAKSNVVRVHGLVLDYDKDADWDRVHALYRCAEGLIYTTKSHSETTSRLRVVLPFARPVSVTEYERIWTWFAERSAAEQAPVDRQCKDASRYWYDPTKPPGGWRAERFTGPTIDPDRILERIESQQPKLAVARAPTTAPFASTDEKIRRARAYLARMPGGVQGEAGNNKTFKAVAAVVRGFDLPVADAERLILEEYNPRCDPPWPEHDIARMVTNCEEKSSLPRGYLLEMSNVIETPTESARSGPQPVPPRETSQADWRKDIKRKPDGFTPTKDYCNTVLFIENFPEYHGKWSMDERTDDVWFDGKKMEPGLISDIRSRCGRERLVHGFTPTTADVEMAIAKVASKRRFHPIRDYLNSVVWDGVKRLDSVANDYLGAPTANHAVMIRKFMIGAVIRIMKPGEKLDTALMLFGPQGYMKSTFFKILGGDWHDDSYIDLTNKDGLMQLHSSWIYEFAELENSIVGRAASRVKAFLSSAFDTFRAPYSKEVIKRPRSSVVCGTTNEQQFLSDSTGDRRFWVVSVTKQIPADDLRAARDQLWAEAVQAWRAGEIHWLTPDEDALLHESNAEFRTEDPWIDAVRKYLANPSITETTPADVLSEALGLDHKVGWHEARRIGAIFKQLNWIRSTIRHGETLRNVYVRCSRR